MSQLQKLFVERGHILTMSPKCRPECAGHGIEFGWGASKLHYRRNNDLVAAHFFRNVLDSLKSVSLRQTLLFERRARAYRWVQTEVKEDGAPAHNSFDLVEKAVKERKAHRNAADFDSKFIRSVVAADGVAAEQPGHAGAE